MTKRSVLWLLALLCLGTAPQASALATVCTVNFAPESGGPGTVVRIDVAQCYSGAPFFLQPGISIPYSGPSIGLPTFRPVGKPLPGVNLPGDAFFNTTVTIPSHLPDGSYIGNREMVLAVTDKNGNDISEGGMHFFTITSSDLPATGSAVDLAWLPSILAAVLVLVGGVLSRKIAA